jgi:hypothetical protein
MQLMNEGVEFRVSAQELGLLRKVLSRDPELISRLSVTAEPTVRGATIRLSRAEAEQVRDHLTTELAASGFDQHYSPNEEGRMLEELIDRFYIP